MIKSFGDVISILFHPLFSILYVFLMLFNSDIYLAHILSPTTKNAIYAIVFFNTCLIPAIFTFYLYKREIITSLKMENQEERTMPFFTIAVFHFVTYVLFRNFNFPHLISGIILGSGISILFALLINFRYKISIHMVGIGGSIAVIYGLSEHFLFQISNFLV